MTAEHSRAHGPANRGRVAAVSAAPLFVCEPARSAGAAPRGTAVIALHGPRGITAGFEWGLRAIAAQGFLVAAPIHYYRDGGDEYVSPVGASRAYAGLTDEDIDADVDAAADHVTGRLRLRLAAVLGTGRAEPAVRRAARRYPRAAALTVPDDRDGQPGDETTAGWLTVAARLGSNGTRPAGAGTAASR